MFVHMHAGMELEQELQAVAIFQVWCWELNLDPIQEL